MCHIIKHTVDKVKHELEQLSQKTRWTSQDLVAAKELMHIVREADKHEEHKLKYHKHKEHDEHVEEHHSEEHYISGGPDFAFPKIMESLKIMFPHAHDDDISIAYYMLHKFLDFSNAKEKFAKTLSPEDKLAAIQKLKVFMEQYQNISHHTKRICMNNQELTNELGTWPAMR